MTITKRLPVGFLCIFGATTALFSAAIWCQWDNLKSIHEERQISTINRFATNLDSFFATQAMVLSFIEQHILSGNDPSGIYSFKDKILMPWELNFDAQTMTTTMWITKNCIIARYLT